MLLSVVHYKYEQKQMIIRIIALRLRLPSDRNNRRTCTHFTKKACLPVTTYTISFIWL